MTKVQFCVVVYCMCIALAEKVQLECSNSSVCVHVCVTECVRVSATTHAVEETVVGETAVEKVS